jgi:hypothetical protein
MERIRRWEDDEREKMRLARKGSLELIQIVAVDGEVRHLDHLRQGDLDQLMCERPSGSSHVGDGGGDAHELTQVDQVNRGTLSQFECERPSGSSHVLRGT